MRQPVAPLPTLVWGVVPSLVAWPAVLMPAHAGLVLLGLMLVVSYLVDRRSYPRLGAAPWLVLRFRLSAVAATAEANTWCQARYDALNPMALKRLVQGGAVLRAFPQSILEACYKANAELMAEASAKSAPFKRMYESMMAFQRDQVAWFKVAEAGFDNFMSRQKL
jgi:TRAP-type mannitol/chloroaromatic compound transport system substrate-binding protein